MSGKRSRGHGRKKSSSSRSSKTTSSDSDEDINVSKKRWNTKDTTFLVNMIKKGKITDTMSPKHLRIKYGERFGNYPVAQVSNCMQRIRQKGGKGLSDDCGEFEFLSLENYY